MLLLHWPLPNPGINLNTKNPNLSLHGEIKEGEAWVEFVCGARAQAIHL
jgi:hypothetical protein